MNFDLKYSKVKVMEIERNISAKIYINEFISDKFVVVRKFF